MENDVRTIALTNIMAAQKVIEKSVRGAIADCEEIKNRCIEFREKERPDSLERNRYNRDIYDQEVMLKAYNHCLRIITGEQKLMEEKMF